MKIAAALLLLSMCAVAADAADKTAIKVVRDVAYVNDANPKHHLDLYLPQSAPGAPVIVSLYGGALTAGDKNQQTFIGERFASAGIVTAVVNYRLTPEVSHPAHVQDAAAAVAWIKRHVAEYGGNANQLFVIGHSAGAYLAALLATDERYLASEHVSLSDIRGVVPVSAFYWVERTGVAPDRDKRVWGTDSTAWPDASPAHHLHNRVPPMLILYADGDDAWRRDQNVEAARALKAAGNARVDIVQLPGRTHNSIWSRVKDDGDEAAERIVQFVRKLTATNASSR